MQMWHSLIGSLPFAWSQYTFMHFAFLAVLLVSPLFALLGCLIINNQMAFFSEAVGHAALTGIGIGVLLGLGDPLWAMAGFAAVLALAVSFLRARTAASGDTIIGLTMSFTVALGVVLLSKGGNFSRYSRYLVGDILTITEGDLRLLGLLFAGVLLVWSMLFNKIFFVTVSRTLAGSRAVRVFATEAFFAVTVALTVTLTIPLLGLLVVNSLLILPAAASRNMARNTPQYLAGAAGISVFAGICGLIASFYWATATGATIVLVLMAVFLASIAIRRNY